MKKHFMMSSGQPSPMLTRANTHDGITKFSSKTASAPPTFPAPVAAATTTTTTTTPVPAIPGTVPPPPPIGLIPVSTPTVPPPDTNKGTAPTNANKGKAASPAVIVPTSPSNANKSKATPPAVKAKPVTKTPEFSRKKMENQFAEGAHSPSMPPSTTFVSKSALAHTNPTSPLAAISKSHTLPAISKTLENLSKATPLPPPTTTTTTTTVAPEVGREPEHVYEDPNLSKEESEEMYMNSSVVVAMVGSTTQLGGSAGGKVGVVGSPDQQGVSKNRISVQMDSGFDQEDDKTWPSPKLPEISSEPHYQNVKILMTEEYAKPGTTPPAPTAQYTALHTTPSTRR